MDTLGAKMLLALGGLLVLFAAYGAHALQVSHLREQLAVCDKARIQAKASADALKNANDDFALKLAEQNKQIDAMQVYGKTREHAAAAALIVAQTNAAKGFANAQATLKQAPAMPGNACASLDTLLNATIKARK